MVIVSLRKEMSTGCNYIVQLCCKWFGDDRYERFIQCPHLLRQEKQNVGSGGRGETAQRKRSHHERPAAGLTDRAQLAS